MSTIGLPRNRKNLGLSGWSETGGTSSAARAVDSNDRGTATAKARATSVSGIRRATMREPPGLDELYRIGVPNEPVRSETRKPRLLAAGACFCFRDRRPNAVHHSR